MSFRKLSQGVVCLLSQTGQHEEGWDEPIAGSRLAALHVVPSRLMFWNCKSGQAGCNVPVFGIPDGGPML